MRSVAAAAVLLGAGLAAGHALADTAPVPVPTVSGSRAHGPRSGAQGDGAGSAGPYLCRCRRARRSLPRPCPRRLPAPAARRPGRRPSLHRSARLPRRSARSSGARPGPPHRGPPRRGAPARRVEGQPERPQIPILRSSRTWISTSGPKTPTGHDTHLRASQPMRGWSWSSNRSRRRAASPASSR